MHRDGGVGLGIGEVVLGTGDVVLGTGDVVLGIGELVLGTGDVVLGLVGVGVCGHSPGSPDQEIPFSWRLTSGSVWHKCFE